MPFDGTEKAHVNCMIHALREANHTLLEMLIEEAITKSHVPHKGDTLGLDQGPENSITDAIHGFDRYSIVITEERGTSMNPLAARDDVSVRGFQTFCICDPCNRSSPFRKFLEERHGVGSRVRDVIFQDDVVEQWESDDDRHSPARITGANAALTFVRRGRPFGTVILNYITQEITVACAAGSYVASVPRENAAGFDFDYIRTHCKPLVFRQPTEADEKRTVTFLGKPGRGYKRNFECSHMVHAHELDQHVHFRNPGGPTRILYLTTMQPESAPVGFIMANGEKIGEWIHWLPFVMFMKREDDQSADALSVYEVSQDDSLLRDGYLMMPSQIYSAFRDIADDKVVVNVDFLRSLDNPSKYRATMIVTPSTNKWAVTRAAQYGYRKISIRRDDS